MNSIKTPRWFKDIRPPFLAVGIAAFGLCGLIGIFLGLNHIFPANFVKRAQNKLTRVLRPGGGEVGREVSSPSILPTIFFPIQIESFAIPIGRPGNGGAITRAGDRLVLLTHDGRFFSFDGHGAGVQALPNIAAPNNGFAAYAALAKNEDYRDYTFQLAWMRFNDVVYYETAGDRHLAVSYTEFDAANLCYTNTVAALTWAHTAQTVADVAASPSSWRVLHRTRPCLPLKREWRAIEGHMAGGRMAVSRDGRSIVLASGEYGWDGIYAPEAIAQNAAYEYGKVLEIDTASGSARTMSTGHRNTQGLTVDDRGRIWVTEHGPRGGDELNLVRRGANYGWPLEIFGTQYNRAPVPSAISYGRHETFEAPFFAWVPSIAISSVTQVRNFHPAWDGDLLVASLAQQSLFRVRIQNDRVIFVEPVAMPKGGAASRRIRYAMSDTEGAIVLWTDGNEVLFLRPSAQNYTNVRVDSMIARLAVSDTLRGRVRAAVDGCAECHSVTAGENLNSPSLGDVYGRRIAGTSFANYSSALRETSGTWSEEALRQFISDPQAFAPGTNMPDPGVDNPEVIRGVIAFLRDMKNPESE